MAYITSVERIALQQGEMKGKLDSALLMVKEFNHSVKEVADKLSIPLKDLVDYINQRDQSNQ